MNTGYLGAIVGGMAVAGTALGVAVSTGFVDVILESNSSTSLPITRAQRNPAEVRRIASVRATALGHEEGSTGLKAASASERRPRDPSEWQGMPVNYFAIPCSEEAVCQAALACIDGYCNACSSSDECQAGEVCVVEHCVLAKLAKCASFRDCPSGEVCVLSGYSDDLRGNGSMESMCSGSLPEREPQRAEYPPEAYLPIPSPLTRLTNALGAQ